MSQRVSWRSYAATIRDETARGKPGNASTQLFSWNGRLRGARAPAPVQKVHLGIVIRHANVYPEFQHKHTPATPVGFARTSQPWSKRMERQHRVPLMAGHRVDVTEATRYLQHALGCDDWYVACHHEHQFVVHLTKAGTREYAVCFDCSPPVEKAIYHGSLASAVFIVPIGAESDPSPELLTRLKHGLEELTATPHVFAQPAPQPPTAVESNPEPAHPLGDRVRHWLHRR